MAEWTRFGQGRKRRYKVSGEQWVLVPFYVRPCGSRRRKTGGYLLYDGEQYVGVVNGSLQRAKRIAEAKMQQAKGVHPNQDLLDILEGMNDQK
jgi:hypothetical protein